MNLATWLARRAALSPEAPALFEGTEQVADYAAFADQAARVAGWLTAQAVQPGDRVAIFMGNCPDYLVVFYGVWMAGAVVVPINAKLHGREAVFILENAEVACVFASASLASALVDAGFKGAVVEAPGAELEAIKAFTSLENMVHRRDDDLAWLFYTSGTTGKPKGVMITHGMLRAMALCYEADVEPVRAQDAALYAAPMSHGAGIYNLMHVRAGARHVCPASGGFDAAEIAELSTYYGAVHMFAAPTMVKRMTQFAKAVGWAGEGLRTIVYAGGPMYNADIIEAVDTFGDVFAQIYGQGECPMGITVMPHAVVSDRAHPRWSERLASVGVAQAAVEVRIGGADGHPLPVGAHGEIMVRGQTVMPGYWRNPQATEKTIQDGWLMTGDMGWMDAEGFVTLQDRSKDMIISGGSNVYPREVEEVLMQHPQVVEASVVGRPHPEWGEEVVAFIVGDAAEGDLDALCLENIARFKRPKGYVRLEELPKNNYGKVLKTALREML
ncbi:AMP-binding protein [Sulfitobacter sp. TSTF-M16]|uniref:3-methylmercaptopropionyl-CoA ligase n=1 Tax=Sulfitobacter aestuariivivens TaxID=2766981 RepID=A0A927HF59_9RHOB|nr:AMP-binding protein [Sulfitobacter aestuariivivens]MBD3662890.1 AMP-binding protein [Sulfitobacter aestuariivivens]